jgi:hypothetical protein
MKKNVLSMKKFVIALLFTVVLAAFFSSCASSRGGWSDCPSHDKNYFRSRAR